MSKELHGWAFVEKHHRGCHSAWTDQMDGCDANVGISGGTAVAFTRAGGSYVWLNGKWVDQHQAEVEDRWPVSAKARASRRAMRKGHP